jgi:hypothetical protein
MRLSHYTHLPVLRFQFLLTLLNVFLKLWCGVRAEHKPPHMFRCYSLKPVKRSYSFPSYDYGFNHEHSTSQ